MRTTRAALLTLALGLTVSGVSGAGWTNLDDAHRLSGRKASAGYLLGKVVMLERFDFANDEDRASQKRMQDLWKSFHGKPFVMLGGVSGGTPEDVKAFAEKEGLAFGLYADLAVEGQPVCKITVVNARGKPVYFGSDERKATEIVVSALTDWRAPKNFTDAKAFLDFELENLPAHAVLRFADMKKRFAKDKANAAALKACEAAVKPLKSLPKLADVVKLVNAADRAKDFAAKTSMDRKRLPGRVRDTISKYKDLKDSADARLAQEAKNALADLQWKLIELEN